MDKQKNFPSGWDERMTLDELDLWDTSDLHGHEKMGVIRGNNALEQKFRETKSMLPKLIAAMRWSTFGWSRDTAKVEVGLSGNGYSVLETDLEGRMPQFHTYYQLLQRWNEEGVSVGVHDQCLDLVTMPGIFEQKNPKRNETYDPQKTLLQVIEETRNGVGHTLDHNHMIAFYHRIGYDVGHPDVTEQFPSLWTTLHTRGDIGTVPGASEVLDVIDTMYSGTTKREKQMHALRKEEGVELWQEVRKTQYRNRGIEEPMMELLNAMELHLGDNWEWQDPDDKKNPTKPMNLTSEALTECYGFTDLPAQRLMQAEFVGWEEIEEIASRLLDPKRIPKFKKEWKACIAAEKERDSFPKLANVAMEERGLNYKNLADMLGLKISESKRKKSEDKRSTRDRPEAQVRQILNYNRQSGQIAIESLLRILSRDETHYGVLRNAYEMERERYYRRGGASLEGNGLQMRILRELANVSTKDLAKHFLPKRQQNKKDAVREKDLELQRLERQEGKKHPITFERVFAILEQEIELREHEVEKALDVLNEFPEALKVFTGVDQMAANCISGMGGGAGEVSEVMRDHARNNDEWLLFPKVQQTAEKKFVPPLPTLRIMAMGVTGQALEPDSEVIADWYEQFPHQLAEGCPDFSRFVFTKPLPRCLATQIGSVESNTIRFFDERTQGITPTVGTKFLDRLEQGEVEEEEWNSKSRSVLLGVNGRRRPHHIEWKIADLLFHNGQNVRKAVEALLPDLKRLKLKANPQVLPGLYEKELKRFQ